MKHFMRMCFRCFYYELDDFCRSDVLVGGTALFLQQGALECKDVTSSRVKRIQQNPRWRYSYMN